MGQRSTFLKEMTFLQPFYAKFVQKLTFGVFITMSVFACVFLVAFVPPFIFLTILFTININSQNMSN